MDIILDENQYMNQFQANQHKQSSLPFSIREKSNNQNPITNPNNNQKDPQNPASSSSCNFERLFSEIIEAQSDIESMDEGVQKFFSNYIDNIVNPNEMKNTIKTIRQNASLQSKLIDIFKSFLENELIQNKIKVEKDKKITKQIETKTYQVARAKDMFRELNDMLHGDIISHQKEIKKITEENKKIQDEVQSYEKEIEDLSAENKKSYSEELNLLDTVMSFGKKIYNTYVTREEKKKEKIALEEQIMKLKEEKKELDKKFQQEIETIEKEKQNEENNFNQKKQDIEAFLNSFPSKSSLCDSLLKSLKQLYSSRQEKYISLQKPAKTKNSISSSISMPLPELKEHINKCDQALLHDIFNTIEIIRNIHPYLSTPVQLNMDNIIDTMESLITQISCIINEETPQEKINKERQNQIEDIGTRIGDIYRNRFIKTLFFNSLKINCVEEKKKKDAEKKMKELKDKEEKLKQLQMKYINEKSNKTSKKSEKSDNNSFISINDDLDFILKDKETPKIPKDKIKKSSQVSSPSSEIERNQSMDKSILSSNSTINSSNINNTNVININIKDNKKKEEKKKKNSNINVILEEEDISKSQSKSKSKSKIRNKSIDKKERKDSSENDKRNNNKERSIKKRIKPSQNRKKNKKKKRHEGDSSDDNIPNNNEDSFMNQILGIVSDFNDGNKQMKNCETDRKRAKGDMKFGKNKFNYFDESNKKNTGVNDFDLNDLDFLTSLGEEVNKTEKSYGFGRKYNYKK